MQRPWNFGRAAEKFLVEPVPQPSDGLGIKDAWGEAVGDDAEIQFVHPGDDPHGQGAAGNAAPDAEAPFPDVQRAVPLPSGTEVQLMIGDDVVEPSTNNSGNDAEGTQFLKMFLLTVTSLIATLTTDVGNDDACEDTQGVDVDSQRSKMKSPD